MLRLPKRFEDEVIEKKYGFFVIGASEEHDNIIYIIEDSYGKRVLTEHEIAAIGLQIVIMRYGYSFCYHKIHKYSLWGRGVPSCPSKSRGAAFKDVDYCKCIFKAIEEIYK